MPPKINVAEYLEERLGTIDYGWSDRDSGSSVQIVRFRNQPEPGVDTYATLGLSDEQLYMLKSERYVRQELLMCATQSWPERDVVSILLWISEGIARRTTALLRGDVMELGRPISKESELTAVYATNPTAFGEQLLAVDSEQPPIVFVWLIPITSREASFVRGTGWSAFEARLDAERPNLWDVGRQSVSTANSQA